MIVTVIGAGPAGSSAALTALREGAQVALFDKSRFPRHKVCGEFLSPEVAGLLEKIGVWEECERERPSILRSVTLSIGERAKTWKLAEPARGLSRHAMDRILMQAAIDRGAVFHRQQVAAPGNFDVLARGRYSQAPAGSRLFGFKAHYQGPASDSMSLYFFDGAYVGVNAVEGGRTNVCGLAPERILRKHGFDIDSLLATNQPLVERLAPMTREMEWLSTGPLCFGVAQFPANCYVVGDSASFIDPFTGSGMLGAISTGILGGCAAARRTAIPAYLRQSAELLRGQQMMATVLRKAILSGWAERVLPWIPGAILFHSTRPRSILV